MTVTAGQKADFDRTGAHVIGSGLGVLLNPWLPSLLSMNAALLRCPKHNEYYAFSQPLVGSSAKPCRQTSVALQQTKLFYSWITKSHHSRPHVLLRSSPTVIKSNSEYLLWAKICAQHFIRFNSYFIHSSHISYQESKITRPAE